LLAQQPTSFTTTQAVTGPLEPTRVVIPLPIAVETAYQDLIEKAWAGDYARLTEGREGSAYLREEASGRYWYWQPNTAVNGKRPSAIYLGRDDDVTRARVAAMQGEAAGLRERRDLVRSLRGARLPAPDRLTGNILAAMSDAGVFRMRAVVIGSVAFQAYSPLLGVRIPATLARTDDLDIAQFHSIAVMVDDEIHADLEEILRRVDPGFSGIADPVDGRRTLRYALRRGREEVFSVDVLCPLRGHERDRVTYLRALRSHAQVSRAQVIRFLDFLLYQGRPAVAMHGPGVPINVPAPERFALHKLLVGQMRHAIPRSQIKARKDFEQARALVDLLLAAAPDDLRDAWDELIARGPSWRQKAMKGLEYLSEEARAFLQAP
jgi:hypothetical protein